jgi:hypothetical protein
MPKPKPTTLFLNVQMPAEAADNLRSILEQLPDPEAKKAALAMAVKKFLQTYAVDSMMLGLDQLGDFPAEGGMFLAVHFGYGEMEMNPAFQPGQEVA